MRTCILHVNSFYLGAGWTEAGLTLLTLPYSSWKEAEAALLDELAGIKVRTAPGKTGDRLFKILEQSLAAYFQGEKEDFLRIPVDLTPHWLTPFQQSVLAAVKKIPYGQIRTYKEIAVEINNEQAARATGRAVGRNPVPVVIPCHRVTGAGGSIGGFTGGIEKKKILLRLEGITCW